MAAPEPQRVTADAAGASAPGAARLAVGDVIGRYRIDEVLGTGGMGMVLRARDLDLDRDVALKIAVAARDPARDRHRAELLLREARVMARLRVRHVRAVHDVGSARGIDYIAMEYIAGVDLARWLAAPRDLAAIVRVFTGAARGLAAAHAAGVLHRDFKPSNVLVGDDGEVVVTDFGLSRWVDDAQPAEPAGTPHYTAPDADPSDPRTDQYSFCVALGDALARLPADAGSARIRSRLARVVRRGSAAVAAARYPSMVAVVAELEAAARRPRWPVVVAGLAAAAVAAALASRAGPANSASPAGGRGTGAGDRLDALVDRPVDVELEQAAALTARGFLRSARRHAEIADWIARVIAPGRLAAARYAAGFAALLAEDTAAARPALEEAVQLADQAGDDRLRARALLALLQAAVTRGSDLPAADRAERAAVAALARVEPDRDERARLRMCQGILAARHGDAAANTRLLAEARGLLTPPAVDVLIDWCEVLRAQAGRAAAAGQLDTAIATLREAIAGVDELAGRDHMEAISARGQLARALEADGRDDEAQAIMAELRAAGRTGDGARLLDEILGPARATRTVRVAVRDRSGAPIAGATVVAAAGFHASASHLLGASSLYDERDRATVLAVSDARGIAELAVADHTLLWFAAEHAAVGRAPAVRAADRDAVDLALAPWGALSGTAPPGARIALTPEQRPDAPPIVLWADARGRFASDRIPEGAYLVAFCVRLDPALPGDAERCGAHRAVASVRLVASARPTELALALPSGRGSLAVRPRDELTRPIESSRVVLAPEGYAPADLAAFSTGWPAAVAHRPDAFVAWRAVHGGAPARFADLPPGRYALCAAAVHGDTEDPSFTSRLEARRAAVPMFCAPVAIGDAPVERDLVVPAARRLWLGDEPHRAEHPARDPGER
jgi:hypothetical protein